MFGISFNQRFLKLKFFLQEENEKQYKALEKCKAKRKKVQQYNSWNSQERKIKKKFYQI